MAQSSEDEIIHTTRLKKRGWGKNAHTSSEKLPEQEKINPMVPGHRDLYKKAGITKQQIKAGRTKLNRQTPEQEHKSRADGTPVTQKRKPDELVLDEQKMKELIDWMWRTRRNRQGDEDKKWAPAAEIPRQLRPKLNQILQYDWPNMSPYPGWVLAIEQGCSGWKCKLMNEKELKDYENDEVKNKNPKSQKRANEIALAAKKRAEKAASSSSDYKASENETRNTAKAEDEPATEQKETSIGPYN